MRNFILRRLLQTLPMLLLAFDYFYAVCQNAGRFYRRQYHPHRRPRRRTESHLRPGSAAAHPLSPLARPAAARRSRFSLQYQIPVSQLLNQYIWNSFLLASVALVFYWGLA
jgi:peptide/nickel transport system permease protein